MAAPTAESIVASMARNKKRHEVRKAASPLVQQYETWLAGRPVGPALPRDPMTFLEAQFGPLSPIEPYPLNPPLEGDQRGAIRQREMPVGWNMPIGVPGSEGFKLASFSTLRMYADLYSVARTCIQLRKSEVRGLEWDVMPTQEAERRMQGDKKAHRDFAERRNLVVKFFRKPDPDYLKFGSWIDACMEEMFTVDALSLYIHPTTVSGKGPFGSDVAGLELIAGHTIRPLVDTRGGRPKVPSPAFQQYLYGVPRTDLMTVISNADLEEMDSPEPLEEYRGDQLFYAPFTQRSWTPYGFPPLERSIIPTITGLRKQQFQMDFFDEGTIPGNYISPGENVGWTPAQLQTWQDQQNAIAGDPAWKHKSIALPPGSKVFPMRPVELADQFDEVVMTQICMAYEVQPMELGITPKVSSTQSPGAANQMAKSSKDTQLRKSTKPTLAFLTDIFNTLIQDVWQQHDMRFVFEGLEENEDENALVERLVQMLQWGLCSIDEGRIALGKPPWGLPITSDPVYANPTMGIVPLGSIDPTTGQPIGDLPTPAAGMPGTPGSMTPPGAGPGGKPPAGPPGAGGPPQAPGASPAGAGAPPGPAAPPAAPPGAGAPPGPAGAQPPPTGNLVPENPHEASVMDANQNVQAAHNQIQATVHAQAAAGVPMEPPVRPPNSQANENVFNATSSSGGIQSASKAVLSELQALRRHVNKGRDPLSWEFKHIPMREQTLILVNGSDSPDRAIDLIDALIVQRQQAGGMLAIGKADGAANADPKVPGSRTTVWRAWSHDQAVAARYGTQLNDALRNLPYNDLAFGWIASHRPSVKQADPEALSWLAAQGWDKALTDAVARVLRNLWVEGLALGVGSAREQLGQGWGSWEPGDLKAAELVAGEGLQNLLNQYGIATIKAIAQTRLTQLADILALAFAEGWSAQRIADAIRDLLDNPGRARMIADTELARAVSMATQAAYAEQGVQWKKWSIVPDQRVCPTCEENRDQGPVPLNGWFAGGVLAPPQHPHCRCALLPGEAPADTGLVTKDHPRYTKAQVNYREATDSHRCDNCAMAGLVPPDFESLRCDYGFPVDPHGTCDKWTPDGKLAPAAENAGLAVVARDTGRVLMIQRDLTRDEPGSWEFPAGKIDADETPFEAACREFDEETGLKHPPGQPVAEWDIDGFVGFVVMVPSEAGYPFDGREPSRDPENDAAEAIAWWDPNLLTHENESLRSEIRERPGRIRRAIESAGHPARKSLATSGSSGTQTARRIYRQLLRDYPPESISWVLRTRWDPRPVRVPWERINTRAQRSWAASKETKKIADFVRMMKADQDQATQKLPPAVLVDWGESQGLNIVDGHHRETAAHEAGFPWPAWVGHPSEDDRDAITQTHVYQRREKGEDETGYETSDTGKMVEPVLLKVGPEGFIHGYICVRPPCEPDKIDDGEWKNRRMIQEDRIRDANHSISHVYKGPSTSHFEGGGVPEGVVPVDHPTEGHAILMAAHDGVALFQRPDGTMFWTRHSTQKLGYPAWRRMGQVGAKHYQKPGHDAQHINQMVQAAAEGRIDRGIARDMFGHSAKLQAKFDTQLDRQLDRMAGRKPRPAAAPKPPELPALPHDPAHAEIGHELRQALRSGESEGERGFAQGVMGETRLLHFKDGSTWVRKRTNSVREQDREQMAHRVSDAIGAGSPPVVRTKDTEIYLPFVTGGVAADNWNNPAKQGIEHTEAGRRVGLLDAIIDNGDRNEGNWLIHDGKPVPIDHGLADFDGEVNGFGKFARALKEDLQAGIVAWSPAQWHEWEQALQALRPDFQANWKSEGGDGAVGGWKHDRLMQAFHTVKEQWAKVPPKAGAAVAGAFKAAPIYKVGPEGFIHGWICVRPPCDPDARGRVTADGDVFRGKGRGEYIGGAGKRGTAGWHWQYPTPSLGAVHNGEFSHPDAKAAGQQLMLYHNAHQLVQAANEAAHPIAAGWFQQAADAIRQGGPEDMKAAAGHLQNGAAEVMRDAGAQGVAEMPLSEFMKHQAIGAYANDLRHAVDPSKPLPQHKKPEPEKPAEPEAKPEAGGIPKPADELRAKGQEDWERGNAPAENHGHLESEIKQVMEDEDVTRSAAIAILDDFDDMLDENPDYNDQYRYAGDAGSPREYTGLPHDPGQADFGAQLKKALDAGEVTTEHPEGGMIGQTTIARFKDGSTWVHKLAEDNQQNYEQIASRVSDVLGAGAPHIVRTADNEVYMPFVDGTVAADDPKMYTEGMDYVTKQAQTPAGRAIGMLDGILGNEDRNSGNWIIRRDGTPVPIDHGLMGPDGQFAYSAQSPFSDQLRKDLKNGNTGWSKSQLTKWRSGLDALGPEFRKIVDPSGQKEENWGAEAHALMMQAFDEAMVMWEDGQKVAADRLARIGGTG